MEQATGKDGEMNMQKPININSVIACEACRLAQDPQYAGACDMKCVECCCRHINRSIGVLGEFGDAEHTKRIKDRLFEMWSKE